VWELAEKARAARSSFETAIALRSDSQGLGDCSVAAGDNWLNKLAQISCKEYQAAFQPHLWNHLTLVADPGSHSYKDCLVSVAYSWETNYGCYPPWQHLHPSKFLLPTEANMDEAIELLAANRKLERVSTYKQMQGLSNQISHLTSGKLTIDDFSMPPDSQVRALEPNEERRLIVRGEQRHALILDRTNDIRKQVLPRNFTQTKLLILQLDQCSVGCAGVAHSAFQLGKVIYGKFDKIHRIMNDLKGAEMEASVRGCFRKAKLWSSYLYGLNNRPFGSGAHFTLKKTLLNVFVSSENIDSAVFKKYVARIAKAWGKPCDTREEQQRIFDDVAVMKSFHSKGGQPKLSNWFSWNSKAHEEIKDFWPTKMVFESVLASQPDPDDSGDFETGAGSDPRAQLQQMLKSGGGINLAYKLLKTDLDKHVRILWVAEKACWDWYTHQIKSVKLPSDTLAYSLRLCDGQWASEPHLWKITENTLITPKYLRFMGIPVGTSREAAKAMSMQWQLKMRRGWTMSRHGLPPESYAAILGRAGLPERVAARMEREFQNLLGLEERRHYCEDANELWTAMPFTIAPAIRLIWEFFARDYFRHSFAF